MTPLRSCLVAISLTCELAGPAAAASANDVAPTTVSLDACAWDRPGHHPFMGDVVAAVDRYRDLPRGVRARLKVRMARRDYDDVVSIRRDSITGRFRYGAAISDMHFGTHLVCRTVTRAAWSERMQERGLVYCDSGQCILVPTVCRNVSRIARVAVANHRVAMPAESTPATVARPDGEPADFATGVPPATLAMDESPSFAARVGGGSADRLGSSTGGVPVGGAAAPGGPTSDSMVSAVSAPPAGSDAPAPIALPAVPEPHAWALMLAALAVLVAWRRRRIEP